MTAKTVPPFLTNSGTPQLHQSQRGQQPRRERSAVVGSRPAEETHEYPAVISDGDRDHGTKGGKGSNGTTPSSLFSRLTNRIVPVESTSAAGEATNTRRERSTAGPTANGHEIPGKTEATSGDSQGSLAGTSQYAAADSCY